MAYHRQNYAIEPEENFNGNASIEVKRSPLVALVDDLRKQAAELDEMISRFGAQIDPILAPQSPANEASSKTSAPRPVCSHLEEELRGLGDQIRASSMAINDLQHRVAL